MEIEIDTEEDPLPVDYGPEWKLFWRSRKLQAYRECFADEEDSSEFEDDDPESAWLPPRDERPNGEQWYTESRCRTENRQSLVLG